MGIHGCNKPGVYSYTTLQVVQRQVGFVPLKLVSALELGSTDVKFDGRWEYRVGMDILDPPSNDARFALRAGVWLMTTRLAPPLAEDSLPGGEGRGNKLDLRRPLSLRIGPMLDLRLLAFKAESIIRRGLSVLAKDLRGGEVVGISSVADSRFIQSDKGPLPRVRSSWPASSPSAKLSS